MEATRGGPGLRRVSGGGGGSWARAPSRRGGSIARPGCSWTGRPGSPGPRRCGAGRRSGQERRLRQLAVGDAGGGEEHVAAPDQVIDGQDLVEVVAGLEGGPALVVVAGPQPPENG